MEARSGISRMQRVRRFVRLFGYTLYLLHNLALEVFPVHTWHPILRGRVGTVFSAETLIIKE